MIINATRPESSAFAYSPVAFISIDTNNPLKGVFLFRFLAETDSIFCLLRRSRGNRAIQRLIGLARYPAFRRFSSFSKQLATFFFYKNAFLQIEMICKILGEKSSHRYLVHINFQISFKSRSVSKIKTNLTSHNSVSEIFKRFI